MNLVKKLLVPISAVLVLTVVRWQLTPWLGDQGRLLIYFLAILLSGLMGGFWSGILATVFSVATAAWFFFDAHQFFHIATPAARIPFILFFVIGVITSALIEMMHSSRRQLERKRKEISKLELSEREVRAQSVRVLDEKRSAEEARQASEERLHALAELIPQIVFVRDAVGAVIYCNQHFYEYTGLQKGQESNWLDVVHPEDRERACHLWEHSLSSGETYEIQYRLIHRSGEYRWYLSRAVPVKDEMGKSVQWFGTATDINEQKLLLERLNETATSLRRSQDQLKTSLRESEAVCRMKDEFLSTLSHELRTPLSAILGWAELLTCRERSPEFIKQGLDTIHRNAILQSELINDLLDVSRILSGKLRLAKETVDLEEVVKDAVESCRVGAEAKAIRLRVEPACGDISVLGDANRLQQVLWNLITNAVKFTPTGGEIAIQCRQSEASVEVSVRDSGQGIDADFLPHVFERFRQADSSITRKHGGLGLGLAIVRHLTEMHGGSARVESEGSGKGATFIISLPTVMSVQEEVIEERDRSTHAPRIEVIEPWSLQGKRILIVDDVRDTLELLKQILMIEGAEVESASSAQEAFEHFTSQDFDFIVSDIGMPHEDGYSLLRRVRRYEEKTGQNRLPALALTAYARDTDATQAREAVFDLHLAKPVTPNRVLGALGALGRASQKDQNISAANIVYGIAEAAK